MKLAQRSASEREAALERCELCGAPMAAAHRHVLEMETRDVRCSCRPCALLFDRGDARRFKLVPEGRWSVGGLALDDALWEELRLPVDVAFFFRTGDGVKAYYPSPLGPTESLLPLDAWDSLEAANPVLRGLEPDVEALLVHRVRGARRHWIVPIDDCYALVGLIRTHWRGFTGGRAVWEELDRFYEGLDRRARPATRDERR